MLTLTNISPISPFKELIAYETLWADRRASFKWLSELFANHPGSRPSDFVQSNNTKDVESVLKRMLFGDAAVINPNLLINGTFNFPQGLKDAKEPIELLYYAGLIDLLYTRCVAIVGTRTASDKGLVTTAEIATKLVNDHFTIVSGLATGIDTAAHTAAIGAGGKTIAVIGTPLNKVYPKENSLLQQTIASEHLLLSQVPFYRYSQQDYRLNRLFFLERNKTMSALTEATLIVEAGETSGSLTQATAALYQKRKVLIWEDCFHNKNINWPQRFVAKGARRVSSYEDIKKELAR